MLIIGIDPGISGAICFFQNGEITDVIDMPSMADGKKNKRQINSQQVFNEVSERIINIPKKEIIVVIEQVSAMQLSMYFVRPAKWKKYYGLIKTEKDASRTKVIEIFPYISNKLSKKKDSNKADAILIANFFNNTYQKAE